VTTRSVPTRTLPDGPNLDQLRRQAKELLEGVRAGDADSQREVQLHYRRLDPSSFALHDAQLVLARAYGFESWPKLKAFVDGVTVRRLVDAVGAGDVATVRSMVAARPELVDTDVAENDEHRALHHAVLRRQPEIVRFLMQHGADPRKGIWPHRGATTALTLAIERGFDEIVRIIEEEEQRRPREAAVESPAAPADDKVVHRAHAAVANGDADWLRARQKEGAIGEGMGLLSQAVAVDRPDMVTLLLDLGFDPDEPERVGGLEEYVPTFGSPLRACAIAGNLQIAEILLRRGANPNTNVYASSWALYEAYKRRNDEMIALLEQYGGRLTAIAIADLGLVDEAAKLLAADAAGQTKDGMIGPASSVAQDLLWGAIESPSPEIIAVTLETVDWSRDDDRWHSILENGLYLGPNSDRPRYLEAFRRVLERADPNVRGSRHMTLLHHVAASRGGLNASDRVAYATLLLDHGARHDIRDVLLQSTPLGWACRWGRTEMAELLLERGADPVEADAEPWASPAAWAKKMGHGEIAALLSRYCC
jgi:ankyrin repeat protein